MSEDIVTRLRGLACTKCAAVGCMAHREAADEIERLRTELGVLDDGKALAALIQEHGLDGLEAHGWVKSDYAVERENADRLAAALREARSNQPKAWATLESDAALAAHDALRGHTPERTEK